MRRLLLGLAFAAGTTAVSAAGWESGMIEDEGGPVMMAWVYATESGDVPAELRMMCGDGVNLRYGMGSGPGEGIEPIVEPLDFTFSFGTETVVVSMRYEEMDGAFAAYFASDAPIIGLLRSSPEVIVSDPTKTWRDQPFTLVGSSAAIGTLLKSCE